MIMNKGFSINVRNWYAAVIFELIKKRTSESRLAS